MCSRPTRFIPTYNNLTFAAGAVSRLDDLCAKRQALQDSVNENSTTRLYDLLAAIYAIYDQAMNTDIENSQTLRQQLLGKLKARGVNVRKVTGILDSLMRYVFKSNSRSFMLYKYVILAAFINDVSPANFTKWVGDLGGVSAVRKKISLNRTTIDPREDGEHSSDPGNPAEILINRRPDAGLANIR